MKKEKKSFVSNFLTFSILFSSWMHTLTYASSTVTGDPEVDEILIDVANVLLVIGGLVCVWKLIQIGIKYMMTSIDEKSNAKMAMIPWLVGTVVCFGATWIGRLIIGALRMNQPVLKY